MNADSVQEHYDRLLKSTQEAEDARTAIEITDSLENPNDNQKIRKLQKDRRELRKEIHALQETIDVWKEQYRELQKENDRLVSRKNVLEQENDELRKALGGKENE